jgi:hypothetical protein
MPAFAGITPEKLLTGFRKRSCSDNKLERDDDSRKNHPAPEHDPEKWVPVFGKDHAPTKLERDDDSKKSHPALGVPGGPCTTGPPPKAEVHGDLAMSPKGQGALSRLFWHRRQLPGVIPREMISAISRSSPVARVFRPFETPIRSCISRFWLIFHLPSSLVMPKRKPTMPRNMTSM